MMNIARFNDLAHKKQHRGYSSLISDGDTSQSLHIAFNIQIYLPLHS
jgi:hypothetical protein